MFPTQHIAARTRRIGLGIAVAALAVTTMLAPIGASAQEQQQEYETVTLAQKDQPSTQPSQPPIKIPITSDISVIGRGKTTNGNTTTYHFLVKNLGPANAPKINLYRDAQIQQVNGPGWNIVGAGYTYLDLKAGESQAVSLDCTPPAGYTCIQGQASVTLDTFADTNFRNDVIVIH
jgi:hypothetical protein